MVLSADPVHARGKQGNPPAASDNNQQTQLHIEQSELNALAQFSPSEAFDTAFEVGDGLFEHRFKADEGVGANVGNGQRFTLVPRADLTGHQQWATHTPRRFTGPNAQSCNICHGKPFGDGAGPVVMNNIQDPLHMGLPAFFINRQTPHLFGIGALQRLAEEMTSELHTLRDEAISQASITGTDITQPLQTKEVSFGSITVSPDGSIDTNDLDGIDDDLIVKPFEWKGMVSHVRDFVRGAAHNELGLQATEMTGHNIDGDGDGVVNELSTGDITALVIYQAAQPRPVTKLELSQLGQLDPLSARQTNQIALGEQLFSEAGCASCHKPQMTLNDPVYSEPSLHTSYRDSVFPSGQFPEDEGVSVQTAIQFDLTEDLPDNPIQTGNNTLGNFEKDGNGGAIVRLYGDLKRHDMGQELAESIDAGGISASVFLTKELWGAGSTAPYLHDGRATTLEEAIAFHGGESASSRDNFNALSANDQRAVIAFLKSLVLYKTEEE
ncbi:di-heme oxidoredictase family protein [Oceanospirillum sediminis]|uniref:Cytochrome c domain-containing protein n=1 Tax=Oceanospirillum sediminis TaxID=2760088 RepID=A0A839ITD2_9GAMM|nr:hypothetical protein [Oceanospirillum sediminis]